VAVIDVPPRVAAKAVELGLGDCEYRFRRRPGIPGVIGILAFTALPVMLLQVDPVQATGSLPVRLDPGGHLVGGRHVPKMARRAGLHLDTTVVGLKQALHLVRLRTRTFRS
jgi:hypothetical protein